MGLNHRMVTSGYPMKQTLFLLYPTLINIKIRDLSVPFKKQKHNYYFLYNVLYLEKNK